MSRDGSDNAAPMTVGSLFSGIGGIDLGLERAGMTVRWQSEIDPYASRVLAKHWPDVPNLGDITVIDWSTVERVDLICGGYPCQPFSLAGARAGTTDRRHLWPHMLDAIRHLRPRYALLENVPGHLSLGFGRVLGDLAEIGYDTEWDCIPAAAVGAPHLRDRVFVVAHPYSEGQPVVTVDGWPRPRLMVPDTERDELRVEPVTIPGRSGPALAGVDGTLGALADTRGGGHGFAWAAEPDVGRVAARFSAGLDGGLNAHEGCIAEAGAKGVPGTARLRALREHITSAAAPSGPRRCDLCGHPLSGMPCRGACAPWRLGSGGEEAEDLRCLQEGLLGLLASAGEDVQPFLSLGTWSSQCSQAVGRRVDRLRCLGNSVVPQVAEHIGRMIMEAAA